MCALMNWKKNIASQRSSGVQSVCFTSRGPVVRIYPLVLMCLLFVGCIGLIKYNRTNVYVGKVQSISRVYKFLSPDYNQITTDLCIFRTTADCFLIGDSVFLDIKHAKNKDEFIWYAYTTLDCREKPIAVYGGNSLYRVIRKQIQ